MVEREPLIQQWPLSNNQWKETDILRWQFLGPGKTCLGQLQPCRFNGKALYPPEVWDIIVSFWTDSYFDEVFSQVYGNIGRNSVSCSGCGAKEFIAPAPFVVGVKYERRNPSVAGHLVTGAYCSEQSMRGDGADYDRDYLRPRPA